jgi:simple sugar transport system ATP-binding protein
MTRCTTRNPTEHGAEGEEMSDQNTPVLKITGLTKSFGAIRALQGVDLEIRAGETVALVGDNGAGKSTLVKCVSGVHVPDSGEMLLDGEPLSVSSPKESRERGIETVYQDLALVEELDVAGNFYLGRELYRGGVLGRFLGLLDLKRMRAEAQGALDEIHVRIPDIGKPVQRMSGGQRQGVAIGRSVFWGRRLLILDEPTAALGVDQSEEVLSTIERLRDRGLAILLISHNMENVMRASDRVVVLRQGSKVAELDKASTTGQEIVGYITGAIASQAA